MIIDAQELPGHSQTICVTGARGFIASWLVKLLLERGYTIKGTVRNTEDSKNNYLKAMEGAADRLILCNADLSDFDALRMAIHGCNGVFHTASLVTDDPELMVEPAVRGTKYVIDAAAEAGVQCVVFTSSIGAVTMDPNRGPDVVVDESCWSDLEFCKSTKNWYCYGKAVAEKAACDLATEKGVDLVVVNLVLVLAEVSCGLGEAMVGINLNLYIPLPSSEARAWIVRNLLEKDGLFKLSEEDTRSICKLT